METNHSAGITRRETCSSCDSLFWPAALGCDIGRFDFSLFFEQTVLGTGPCSILLLCALPRLIQLSNDSRKASYSHRFRFKIVCTLIKRRQVTAPRVSDIDKVVYSLYISLQLSLLIGWSQNLSQLAVSRVAVATAALRFADAIALFLLSYLEHHRSVRPSTIVCAYLVFSTLFDAIQCRTLWLLDDCRPGLAPLFSAMLTTKVAILVLEVQGKRNHLLGPWRRLGPEATSGIVNRGFFWWLNSLLIRGFRATLSPDALYEPDDELRSNKLLRKLLSAWQARKDSRPRRYRLILSVCSALKGALALAVVPRLCLVGFKFAQPFLIQRVINLVQEAPAEQNGDETAVTYVFILATALIYLGTAISTGFYQHNLFRSITMIRGALVSITCIQSLTLDASLANSSGSATLTLTGPDVNTISLAFEFFHEIWACPIEIALAIWLLERQLGPGCIGPAISVIVCTLAMTHLSKYMAPARKAWNDAIQHRVTTTSSVIGSIKEVKMLGLVDSWQSCIQSLRVEELNRSKTFRKFIAYMNVLGNTPSAMAPILTFGIAIAVYSRNTQQRLSIETAFTSLSIISLMTGPLSQLLTAVPYFVNCFGSCDRMQAFLGNCQDAGRSLAALEQDDIGVLQATTADIELSDWQGGPSRDRRALITTRDASFAVGAGGAPILHDISLDITPSTLTIVTGKVGSGKSMLLLGLLGELHATGSVTTSENGAAYCSQSTWLVHGSIKQNILGHSGHGVDERWYQKVVQACALDMDFQQLTAGDQTSVGSKGLALSGGQRHRVALARGLYSRKPLLLVDDVLSSLDATTRHLVWNRVFGPSGLCRSTGTAVVLASHFLGMLQETDNIIVLESGRIKHRGTLSTLDSQGYLPHQAQTGTSNPSLTDKDKAAAQPANQGPESEQVVNADIEDLMSRSSDSSLYWYYFKSIGWSYGLVALAAEILSVFFQLFHRTLPPRMSWTLCHFSANAATRDMAKVVDRSKHTGPERRYRHVFRGLYHVLVIGSRLHSHQLLVSHLFLCRHAVLALVLDSYVPAVRFTFVEVIPKSAQALHWTLLETVMRAPLSFFASTDSGDLVNRFSQDMSLVDRELPTAMYTTTHGLFYPAVPPSRSAPVTYLVAGILLCIGEGVLIVLGAKYLAAAVPFMIIVLYSLQSFYLRTSRQLRILDLQAKAPLYAHLMETTGGLVTIRAFQWQPAMRQTALRLLDLSQRPHYLLFSIQRWLTLVLDIVVAASATLLVAIALLTKTSSPSGIGVAMYNVIGFSQSLADLISSWTSLETSLGAISRLRSFEKTTPSETQGDIVAVQELPKTWPFSGQLELKNVTASYSQQDGAEPALHDISLLIRPGQKVAICGRTGSGKSSLILTLFRLLDYSGSIVLDGVDISAAPREILRSRLITVPQEPVLFPGSLRSNLVTQSPAAQNVGMPTDEEIVSTLEKLGLWDRISLHGGLDIDMADLALSHGQKQLLCLARAVLHKHLGKVIILDEAMSAMDRNTEDVMVKALETEFKDHTVVSVVHRLNTVRDFDTIVVLDRGKVIRVGTPSELLTEDYHLRD
ncbi:ABC transporter [Tolypocladium capitatum]|uniref:ABC transporter n=1 Tax=Tolypocladium capitatum TaxID=45235 RepID=A0A2K3Q7N3_9HYPO|nr:ABC transporter [Tolypocladium capitatum]